MATLNLKGIARLVQDQAAAVQAASSSLIDFSVGSVLRAFVEANAGVGVWLQALVLKVLAASRLATSTGADVDTFIADFGLTRLPASTSAGQVTFSRYTATNPAVVPVGAKVQTADGTQAFQVIADATNPAYAASANGYAMAAGVASINVSVASLGTGPATNVAAGTITTMTTAISGVDLVTNGAPLAGGSAAETDAAVKARFVKYILGLSRGDAYGTEAAILGANINVRWQIVENYNVDGSWRPGFYFVVADDGTGSPSAAFLQEITNAVYAVRPLGVQCAIVPPTIKFVKPSMIIETAQGYDHNAVVGLVAQAIADGINGLGIGVDLDFSRLSAWAYAVAGVTKVSAVTLNGASGDAASVSASVATKDGLSSMPICVIKTNSVVVS